MLRPRPPESPHLCTPAGSRMKVDIRHDFPGGNILVESNEGSTVRISPDLRDTTKPWFYWYFEARASQPGKVVFSFNGGMKIGVRGPAVSLDEGKTWEWL